MKNKFKIIIMLTIVVCMWQMLSGCQSSTDNTIDVSYKTKIVGGSSNTLGVVFPDGCDDPWPVPETPKGKQSEAYEFMGKNITGECYDSWAYGHTPIICDEYRTSEKCRFSVDRNTGELKLVSMEYPGFSNDEVLLEDVENPDATAVDLATEFAQDYIDISKYERTVDCEIRSTETGGEYKYYQVTFSKYVQGFATRDELMVWVTSKGNITAAKWGYIGGFDDVFIQIDKQKVDDSAIAKVKEIYADTAYTIVHIEIEDQILGRTQQEELGVTSFIHIELKDSGEKTFATQIVVFTYLLNE